jgi:hypothetical protein
MLGMMEMLMERLHLRQGILGGNNGFNFPIDEALELQDLPSPGEGEDFPSTVASFNLGKIYGITFSAILSSP